MSEFLRINGIYWGLTAMDIMGGLDKMEKSQVQMFNIKMIKSNTLFCIFHPIGTLIIELCFSFFSSYLNFFKNSQYRSYKTRVRAIGVLGSIFICFICFLNSKRKLFKLVRRSVPIWIIISPKQCIDIKFELFHFFQILDFVENCRHPSGGYSPFPGHDPHLLYTLSAVQVNKIESWNSYSEKRFSLCILKSLLQ